MIVTIKEMFAHLYDDQGRLKTGTGAMARRGAVDEAATAAREARALPARKVAPLDKFSGDQGDTSANILTQGTSSPAPDSIECGVRKSECGMTPHSALATPQLNTFIGRQDSGAAGPGDARADDAASDGRSDSSGAAGHRQSADPAASCSGTPCGVGGSRQDLAGRFEPGAARAVPTVDAQSTSFSGAGTGQSSQPASLISTGDGARDVSGGAPDTAREARALPVEGTKRTKVPTQDEINQATHKKNVVETWRALKRAGKTNRVAARACGHPHMTIYWWDKAYGPNCDFDALLAKNGNSGRKPKAKHSLNAEELAAVRANKLLNNRDRNSGSTTLAILKTIEQGNIRPEIAAELQRREAAGRSIVTESVMNELHIPEIFTRSFRNPREEWLRFNSSPGSLMMTRDEITGATRMIQPGEAQTIDDGTKNFVCTVQMERPGDKCWEKFGVVVGRWQILIHVDHRTYTILGVNHTARPKGQYRAEDLQASLHIGFKQHGRPRIVFLEKGISASDLLHHTLDLAGVKYKHVASPHQKVVEFVFNALWARLSFLPGQVGRTRGEEGDVSAIIESCKRGATDPRDYFLPLETVLRELRKVCEEWNAHLVQSDLYGNWVPQEFFKAEAHKHMRELHPQEEWIFSPTVSDNNGEGYLVRKQSITTSHLVMPGYSWVFDFEAPWLQEYFGARVRLHYNAFEPECPAMAVLQKDFHGERAGTVLGELEQINWLTRHSRRLFGIDETEDIGLIRTRMNAQAMRRNVFAIRPDGKPGVQAHEARNGAGQGERVNNFGSVQRSSGGGTQDVPVGATDPAREARALPVQTCPEPRSLAHVQSERTERDRLSQLVNTALEDISD